MSFCPKTRLRRGRPGTARVLATSLVHTIFSPFPETDAAVGLELQILAQIRGFGQRCGGTRGLAF